MREPYLVIDAVRSVGIRGEGESAAWPGLTIALWFRFQGPDKCLKTV